MKADSLECTKMINWTRAEVYERFVAQYLCQLGWTVIHKARRPGTEDNGELHCERNGEQMIVDVKEARQWYRPASRHEPWCPWPAVDLTSEKQYHHGWVYCSVATDFHALAFIDTRTFEEKELRRSTKKNYADGKPYTCYSAPVALCKHRLLSIAGRGRR